MIKLELGTLEKIDVRDCWDHEAHDFTPWLAEDANIKVLGQAIGLDLEVEAQEKAVGPISADILCKDTATNHWVLIENQLEKTDHTHLGQLMTYAAGLQAVTIVWVAARFTDEHRAALDWLNEITNEGFNFFGLEIEVWRIGDSKAAPKFNVVCKPNDWTKSVSGAAANLQNSTLSPAQEMQLRFWTAFQDFLLDQGGPLQPTKARTQHWMDLALGVGVGGYGLTAVVSGYNTATKTWDSGEIRAEFHCDHKAAKAAFALLEAQRSEIEAELGAPVHWHNPPEIKSAKVHLVWDVDIKDERRWPEYFAWLKAKLEALRQVFGPRVKALPSVNELMANA